MSKPRLSMKLLRKAATAYAKDGRADDFMDFKRLEYANGFVSFLETVNSWEF